MLRLDLIMIKKIKKKEIKQEDKVKGKLLKPVEEKKELSREEKIKLKREQTDKVKLKLNKKEEK